MIQVGPRCVCFARDVLRLLALATVTGAVLAQNPCTQFQYVSGDGSCASCRDFATTTDDSFTGPEACICVDDYYEDELTGACMRCPFATDSIRGANFDISACECRNNWVAADEPGKCQSCGTGGWSMRPNNKNASDCLCNSHWYGPPGTPDGCTRCPEYAVSTRGDNFDLSSCRCRNGWWGLGGETDSCTQCGLNSYSRSGENSAISDCICKNNWWGRNGTCFACPAGSRSRAGENFELSDCQCPRNCYMDNAFTPQAECLVCPANTLADQGQNWELDDCKCKDHYFGTADTGCERCPVAHWSAMGNNTELSDCQCSRDWYGPGGGDCTRCPGRSSSDFLTNTDPDPTVSCTYCDGAYYGDPVLEQRTNSNGNYWAYVSGCERCGPEEGVFDLELRSLPGSNFNYTDCYCPARNDLYESFDDDDVCTRCPNRTRVPEERPGLYEESCVCPSRDWWGPVVWGSESKDCFRCEPYSRIPQDVNDDAATEKTDCICHANFYGEAGDTCTRCPAFTSVPHTDPEYYFARSQAGSEEITDCECPAAWYGPVPRPNPRPHEPAWINEFHYSTFSNEVEFVEVLSLDGENAAGFAVQLYAQNGAQYNTLSFSPEPTGHGFTFTVREGVDELAEAGGLALVNLDDDSVIEFLCYNTAAFSAVDGYAIGTDCTVIVDENGDRVTEAGADGQHYSIQRNRQPEDNAKCCGSKNYKGSYVEDFWWGVYDRHTKGRRNQYQIVVPPTGYECKRCPDPRPFSVRGANAEESDCLCKNNWYMTMNATAGECVQCPSNSWSFAPENIGIESCQCRDDWFLDVATDACVRCPENGQSIRGENVGVESCVCREGYYGANSSVCTRCPGNGQSIIGDNADVSKCSCPQNTFGPNADEDLTLCQACPAGTLTISYGVGVNLLIDSCSCPAGTYGPGFGDSSCSLCPEGTSSRPAYNIEAGACACPDDFYGPGFGECTPCPMNGTSTSPNNWGVYSCQCPTGYAMGYQNFVNGVKQAPTCVESELCDGVLDLVSNKCWKLFNDEYRTWADAEQVCQDWTGPSLPDALAGDPDYFATSGHLASIITREDLDMATLIFDHYAYVQHDELWIGGTDEAEEAVWQWADGSTYNFIQALWGPNEPNNAGSGENCAAVWKVWREPGFNLLTPLLNDYACARRFHGLCSKSPNRCITGDNECSENAECIDRDFGTGFLGYTCECHFKYLDVKGDGTECAPADVWNCDEEQGKTCHELAYCHVYNLTPNVTICSCPEGMVGDGVGENGCLKNAWTVRAVVNLPNIMPDIDITNDDKLANWGFCKESIARLFFNVSQDRPPWFVDGMHHHVSGDETNGYVMTLNGLFTTEAAAQQGYANFNQWAKEGVYACTSATETSVRSLVFVSPDTVLPGSPGVYTWTAGTVGDPLQIAATGFEIEDVYFNPSCFSTGCWTIDLIYTRGRDNFVSFYLPHALRPAGTNSQPLLPGEADLSVDPDYTVIPAGDANTDDDTDFWYWDWRKAPETTFEPNNFPCSKFPYDPATSPAGNPPLHMTGCCIMEFRQTYRPVKAFFDATEDVGSGGKLCRPLDDSLLSASGRPWDISDPWPTGDVFQYPVGGPLPMDGLGALGDAGLFAGMTWSRIDPAGVVDPYIGQYRARVRLDEKELREMAGKLRGTVGVEHTVDTFLGLAEFKPTGTKVLDMFNSQTALHLEKTNFFSVSTHGTNDYTFLEYVNLRLISVYNEDTDLSETVAENGGRTSRTDSSLAAHYVQVTFTLGTQYQPIETGLIPLDSVLAGQGTFMSAAFTDSSRSTPGMFHACDQYDDDSFAQQETFDTRLSQPCAPNANMCVSPASIPDAFVVFNVPLGIDWLPASSADLSEQVFVSMVISAIDTVATGTPNNGDDPQQMKTTLTASIPVVDGGINIFCDGITAKTDLVDVVQVDLIIGSANSTAELSRLRMFTDIANSDLTPAAESSFETASIEAGLMTLVIKGNSSYFEQPGTLAYAVQLEDVISIHIMEPETAKFDAVKALLDTAGEDNAFSSGLDTDGYLLNGAFRFTIDRPLKRAYLEPTDGLLDLCAFNPPRPTAAVPFPTTCVLRRDIRRQTYPARTGAFSTAVEIPQASETDRASSSAFFATFLADSSYTSDLGAAYSQLIADTYQLNGRYKRAYMVNPGYEWTPTQTGGQSIFAISQTILLFALVNLDEGFAPSAPPSYTFPTRRRVLLSTTADTGAGTAGAQVAFQTDPKTLLSSALGLTADRIAVLGVTVGLSLEEACQEEEALARMLSSKMKELVQGAASTLQEVVVLSRTLDFGGQSCPSARRRVSSSQRRSGVVSAATEVMVAFPPGATSYLDVDKLAAHEAVLDVQSIDVSPKVTVGEVPLEAMPEGVVEEDGGSSDVPLIAGIAGGVAGALVLGVGAVVLMRRTKSEGVPEAETINYSDLKAQVAYDDGRQ